MPSFDIVSEIEMHEVTNAVDQAKRELGNRWDFKNVEADIELEDKRLPLPSATSTPVPCRKMAKAKRASW
jgi:uncharacterized protein YajQ (UPF0234 family)